MKSLVLDWLYENELRSYPIRDNSLRTDGAFTLADNVIVDAQFVFDEATELRLTEIDADYTGNLTTFTFSTGLTFAVANNLTPGYQYNRHAAGHLLVTGPGLNDIPEGTYTLDIAMEPSVIYEFGGPWKGVESLQFDDSAALTGELNFIEGYQFDINIALQNIALAIGSLYGDQIGCTKFTDYPENCDTIISFINAASPDGNNEMRIMAGPGFVVWDDPENHRIYVGFAFTSVKDICVDIPPYPI
jgi:hypothetical protein